jgi:hypothetical protein
LDITQVFSSILWICTFASKCVIHLFLSDLYRHKQIMKKWTNFIWLKFCFLHNEKWSIETIFCVIQTKEKESAWIALIFKHRASSSLHFPSVFTDLAFWQRFFLEILEGMDVGSETANYNFFLSLLLPFFSLRFLLIPHFSFLFVFPEAA